jgi:uncharacterized protein (DUF1697 family)
VTCWIALLRGINVGRTNRLPMADLRSTIESLGCRDVTTYIQSGNVVFEASDELDESTLASLIGRAVADRHGLDVPIVLRTAAEIVHIAGAHPDATSGIDPKLLHVLLLDRPPSNDLREAIDPGPYQPDGWTVDGRQIYVRYPNGSARSKLTIDVFEQAFDVTATARNLNTVRKLAEIVGGR